MEEVALDRGVVVVSLTQPKADETNFPGAADHLGGPFDRGHVTSEIMEVIVREPYTSVRSVRLPSLRPVCGGKK